MKKAFIVAMVVVSILSGQSFAYIGSLQVADGELNGTGFWITDNSEPAWFPAELSWSVTQNVNLTWHYEYNLNVYRADVSHFVIETSQTFGSADLINPDYPGASYAIGTWDSSQGNSNPSIPGPVYGVKFNIGNAAVSEPQYTNINVIFDSTRAPVWGDFYAKCGAVGGTQNTIWNESFLTADPLSGPADGSVLNHILVPDSIPEPATMMLLGLGGFMLKRKRQA